MPIPNGSQLVNYPYLYAFGCQIEVTSPTDMSISVGQIRDITNTFDISVSTPLFVSLNSNGAGGIDQGTVIDSGFYAVYVIFDYTNTNSPAGMLSLASSNPLMPQVNGVFYSHYRLIGYVSIVGSAFDDFRILGNVNQREFIFNNQPSILSNGNSTAFATVNMPNAIPSMMATADIPNLSVEVSLNVTYVPASAGLSVIFRSGLSNGSATVSVSGPVLGVPQIQQVTCAADFVSSDFAIQYANNSPGDSTSLGVPSFKFII